jgi:hypothetical protein
MKFANATKHAQDNHPFGGPPNPPRVFGVKCFKLTGRALRRARKAEARKAGKKGRARNAKPADHS